MNSEKSHFMDGLLFGGLLGAAIGVVFAPLAGDKTRELLKQKLKDFNLDEAVNKFSQAYEAGRTEVDKTLKEMGE